MNTTHSYKNKKTRAQAMIEFALALPILLTIIYGMLETGRLLFIYASTVTAARQAVRYGSATGDSPNGMPYYQDCAGIEEAANNVGFINNFDTIDITYDGGVDSGDGSSLPLNPADPACGSFSNVQNGDRIVVTVTTQWQPIVPIIPLEPFVITSQSERTILASVSISVTAVPQYWEGSENGNLSLKSVTASPDTYSQLGQTITYTYTLENTGAGDLAGPFTITDNLATTNCSAATNPLPSGGSTTCTGTYQITQADLDTGSVTNTATPSINGLAFPPSASKTIYVNAQPKLALSITPSATSASLGTDINYTYTLTNTGNVSLSSPYTVADNDIASVNCSGATSPLAPGASTICTSAYSIAQKDIDNGVFTNHALASAMYGSTLVTSNNGNLATANVYTSNLVLFITVSPSVATLPYPNQVISYTYLVTNNSGATVNSLSITDDRVTGITCANTNITAGSSTSCTGSYTVTTADYNAGGAISNTAQATANNGTPVSSNTANASFTVSQLPALSATVSGSPSQPVFPATSISAGTIITYTYVLTNTGNVTLKSPFTVIDNKSTITCSDQADLLPGATRNCTGTYMVLSTDVTAGSIINTGTANAKFGVTDTPSSIATATIITYSNARFSLGLSASPTSITQSNTSIVFTYTITNTGGKPLTSPYSITSSIASIGTFECVGASPLAPGTSTFCTNTYTTSNTVTNTITEASAKDGVATVPSSNLPTITVASNICSSGSLTLSAPNTTGNTAVWTITNNVGSPLTITSLSLNWNTAGNKYLTSAELPTDTGIWSGIDKDGFAIFNGSWTIPVGTTQLRMIFDKNSVSITDFNITFNESGCGPLNNP